MRQVLPILALLILASPPGAFALIPIASPHTADDTESRVLLDRLNDVLALTEKRIHAVFGIAPEATAVVGPSPDAYDILLMGTASKGEAVPVLKINTRVVRDYVPEDLQIAAARSLYQAVWPKFRKSYTPDRELIAELYTAGMTSYAAELIVPGAAAWQYAGLFVKEGRELYSRYLGEEREFAATVHNAVIARSENTCPGDICTGHEVNFLLLGYRIMKTFERTMDPKMIQLMGYVEFHDRLPAALRALQEGSGRKGYPAIPGVGK